MDFLGWTCWCLFQLNLPIMNRMPASLDLAASVPAQPPLMGNVDPSKIDEIRRTVYVGNLNSQVGGDLLPKHPARPRRRLAPSPCCVSSDHHCRAAAGVLQASGGRQVCAHGRRRDPADTLCLCGVHGAGLRRQSVDLQRGHVWGQTAEVRAKILSFFGSFFNSIMKENLYFELKIETK